VDRTIPMLPEKLCNEVCSLRQDEDKLCFSVVMEMDAKGERDRKGANATPKVLKTWIGKTVIRSDRRMAYEEAQEIIEANTVPDGSPVGEAILRLHALATVLRSQRYKDGAINFESQEVKFQLDENAKPIGVYIKESKEANWLIEEFMLLANKTVAEYVGKPKSRNTRSTQNTPPFVYRVHDEPNPEKLNTFVEFVTKLGFSMKTSSRKALAESYNRLFENIAGRGEEHMVDTIAIRTMSKAYYSTENIGHYGLAFPYYTHFTSPIRRYPDLMVHRLLEHYLNSEPQIPNSELLEEYCRHCSVMEKKAADAERTSVKYKQAEYLADKLGQVFPALISGVSKWGIYAEIEDSKCEGMIPIGSLKDDYYMLDEDNYQVIGRRHGRCYKLGYPVHIRVRKVDLIKKQIDFDLVEEEELTPSRKAKASNEKRPSGKTRESNKSQKKRKKR
ncbi:MAG: RNB domain-containing ribonuclease, partial [Bacteroidales bacterium]|nr:RNB domain-containing ribonuclease [Bacteroidales bacterium]